MFDINIENKFFNEKKILGKIEIKLKKAEFISIIGPSGCGKTTFLKIISGLDDNFQGSVKYKDLEIKEIENLGYIFQDARLLPWLSVKENIMLVSKSKDEKEIEEFLKEVGLKDYMNSYIKELSGGMKRRVSIVRAFINRPKILFLDEAFISLDYPSAQNLRKLIYRLYKDYFPIVILVTHDLNEALCLSNRIIFLSSSPSTIIYEYHNNASFDDKCISIKKETILSNYPDILSGKI